LSFFHLTTFFHIFLSEPSITSSIVINPNVAQEKKASLDEEEEDEDEDDNRTTIKLRDDADKDQSGTKGEEEQEEEEEEEGNSVIASKPTRERGDALKKYLKKDNDKEQQKMKKNLELKDHKLNSFYEDEAEEGSDSSDEGDGEEAEEVVERKKKLLQKKKTISIGVHESDDEDDDDEDDDGADLKDFVVSEGEAEEEEDGDDDAQRVRLPFLLHVVDVTSNTLPVATSADVYG